MVGGVGGGESGRIRAKGEGERGRGRKGGGSVVVPMMELYPILSGPMICDPSAR